MKTLNKKEFVNILANNETALVYSKMNVRKDITETIIETAKNEHKRLQSNGAFRKLIVSTPTYIQFSNGSKYYFVKGTKYLLVNDNLLIAVRQHNENFDASTAWDYVVYLIKDK